ncbi:MAG: pyrroline-5-carboxylate reductase family protein [Methanotrichaceae archaeon]
MVGTALDFLANETIGIIGCGHLGRTLAEELIAHGFPKEKLMISYGGSASTLESIKRAGLLENISDNEEICRKSNIIFISVRPQAIAGLSGLHFSKDALVVSCMAGVYTASLKDALGIDVYRIMPSGPATIKERKGIAAVYPRSDKLIGILSRMGLKVFELSDEEMMHAFTVGVCLPAALLVAGEKEADADLAAKIIEKEYPGFEEIYVWAKGVLPEFDSDEERDEYVKKMSTKGGITESIVGVLNSGSTFLEALRMGIARSRNIAANEMGIIHS